MDCRRTGQERDDNFLAAFSSRTKYFLGKLRPFLESIEARLGKSKWLVGDKITMIDFWVGAMVCDKLMNDSNDLNPIFSKVVTEKDFPNFLRYA